MTAFHPVQTSHTISRPDLPADLERCASFLERSRDYRVLRRVRPSAVEMPPDLGACRKGLFVDVETTGLNPSEDQIVELAMLAFTYAKDGSICVAGESFDALCDPGRPIPQAVTKLTGIDDAMVAGKSIDAEEVAAIVGRADLIVAHNASFDRPFCERLSDAFSHKAWGCSYREVAWADEGFEGAKLGQLAAGHGLFFEAHRALDDCVAGLEILSRPLPLSGRTALSVLLDSARRPRYRIRAVDAPYAARTVLKKRNYRWNDGSDGGTRGWYVDVAETAVETERDFLRRQIYRRDLAIEATRHTATDRYSDRCR